MIVRCTWLERALKKRSNYQKVMQADAQHSAAQAKYDFSQHSFDIWVSHDLQRCKIMIVSFYLFF
jgi:hypothetical protein